MASETDNVIAKAVALLKALRLAEHGGSARQLASSTGLPRSTVQRLLTMLADTGMVMQDPIDHRYRIGPQALQIGLGYRRGMSLVSLAAPHMVRVRDATGETVGLSVQMGDARVFIDEVQGHLQLRFASELGRLYPLWSGASGRVLMMGLPDDEVERIMADRELEGELHRARPVAELRELLEAARVDGFATAASETIQDVSSVAVPVLDSQRRVVAALSISGPASRMTAEWMDQLRTHLLQAAAGLSAALGAEIDGTRHA